jgi:hypothetical protein
LIPPARGRQVCERLCQVCPSILPISGPAPAHSAPCPQNLGERDTLRRIVALLGLGSNKISLWLAPPAASPDSTTVACRTGVSLDYRQRGWASAYPLVLVPRVASGAFALGPRVPRPCRSFAVVSPSMSGQTTAGKRAPMVGKWPNPSKLSEMSAQAGGLWIRRVLVRAQEGQCPGRNPRAFVSGHRPPGAVHPGART